MEHMRKGSPASHRFRREYYGQVATFLQLSRKLRILTDGNARDNWVNLKRSQKYIRNLAGAGPQRPRLMQTPSASRQVFDRLARAAIESAVALGLSSLKTPSLAHRIASARQPVPGSSAFSSSPAR